MHSRIKSKILKCGRDLWQSKRDMGLRASIVQYSRETHYEKRKDKYEKSW